METEVELGNSERWLLSMRCRIKPRVRWSPLVTADTWSKDEIRHVLIRLVNVLFDKNMEQLKLLKRTKMDFEKKGSEIDSDDERVFSFRQRWMAQWFGRRGTLETTTQILSMPFTSRCVPSCAYPCYTLQIYSIGVADLSGGLKWPLDVFGMVAVRDSADYHLNIVYYRTRDNCQTLTEEDTFLTLIGPSRAVVLDSGSTVIEVELKVKGDNESEDKYLSFLAESVPSIGDFSPPSVYDCMSKHSSLLFKLSSVADSVEATIFIRVIEGYWDFGVKCEITAAVGDEDICLLQFKADDKPISDDGTMKLSRNVVSVGVDQILDVCYYNMLGGAHFVSFKAAKAGRSYATLNVIGSKLEVLVAWSVVSPALDGSLTWW